MMNQKKMNQKRNNKKTEQKEKHREEITKEYEFYRHLKIKQALHETG